MAGQPNAEAARQLQDPTSDSQSDLGLFSDGGPFEHFPGAALVAGHNGMVLGANDGAEPIVEMLQRGEIPVLRDAINSALNGRAARVNPLLCDEAYGPGGAGVAYDLIILPWAEAPAALILGRDITFERGLREALLDSRQRYKELVEASRDFVWEVDQAGCFTFAMCPEPLGYAAAELTGIRASELLLSPQDFETTPFRTRVAVDDVSVGFRHTGGSPVWLSVHAWPLLAPDGSWRGARGLCRRAVADRDGPTRGSEAGARERLYRSILGAVRAELDPGRLLNAIASALVSGLSATGAIVYRHTADGGSLVVAGAGDTPAERLLRPLFERLAQGDKAAEAVDRRGSILLRATIFGQERNGALCLWRTAPGGSWSDEERLLVAEIAGQIGAANRRLASQAGRGTRLAGSPLESLFKRLDAPEDLAQP